jgi:molybdopterin-binding protein
MPYMPQLLTARQAAAALGISYPTLKNWIYSGKLKTVKTPGGHHRVADSELDRFLPRARSGAAPRRDFRRISGRNQLVGRIVEVRFDGLLAQVKLAIAGQHITSIITADAARELRLKKGETAAALIKSTEVMIVRV